MSVLEKDGEKLNTGLPRDVEVSEGSSADVNVSGHKDQLARQYGLVGLTGMAITVNNAWVVLGSSISVSISKMRYMTLCGNGSADRF